MSYTNEERVNNPIANEVRDYYNDTTKSTIPFYYNHVKDMSYKDRLRGDVNNMEYNMRNMGEDMKDDMKDMGNDVKNDFDNLGDTMRDNLTD